MLERGRVVGAVAAVLRQGVGAAAAGVGPGVAGAYRRCRVCVLTSLGDPGRGWRDGREVGIVGLEDILRTIFGEVRL